MGRVERGSAMGTSLVRFLIAFMMIGVRGKSHPSPFHSSNVVHDSLNALDNKYEDLAKYLDREIDDFQSSYPNIIFKQLLEKRDMLHSKRAVACMRGCLKMAMLHPTQCNSLC